MKELWKKIFPNKSAYVHLLGPLVMILLWFWVTFYPKIALVILLAIVVMSPFLYEIWDRYKVLYSDTERIKDWGWFPSAFFTSEGKFDKWDMFLGFIGIGIGMLIGIFFIL